MVTYGTLVGVNSYTFNGETKITYSIFVGGEKNSSTGLFNDPQIVKFYADEPELKSSDLVYNKKIEMSLSVDLSGKRKPRVVSIKAV